MGEQEREEGHGVADDRSAVGGGARRATALPRELVVVATLAWLALFAVKLVSAPSTDARIAAMDEPATTASRMIERPFEVAAVVVADAPSLEGIERFFGASATGPLGLPTDGLAGIGAVLARAARDVTAASLAAREADDDETATRLAAEAATLAARATIVAAAAGAPAPDLEPHLFGGVAPFPAGRELAGELRVRATGAERTSGTDAIDPRLAGLPELLVLEARDELPPTREWAAKDAADTAIGLLLTVSALAPFALVALLVLVLAQRRFPADPPPMSSRLEAFDGWGAFALGQLGFLVLGTLLALAGAGGLTGATVATTSVPIALFALAAAGWRRGVPGSLAAAVPRLGLDTRTSTVLRALVFGAAVVPMIWFGVVAISQVGVAETSPWSSPYIDMAITGGVDTWRRMALEAGVAAPIFEELAFRGVLFAALRSRMGFAPAALVSSIVFGLQHPYDLAGVLVVTWIGFVLAWLYERTGSLIACMVAHAVYNLSSLAITLVLL